MQALIKAATNPNSQEINQILAQFPASNRKELLGAFTTLTAIPDLANKSIDYRLALIPKHGMMIWPVITL